MVNNQQRTGTRINASLDLPASHALDAIRARNGWTITATLCRALRVYHKLEEADTKGGLYARTGKNGELERIWLL